MANGQRTLGAVSGAATGAAAGPFGAAVGGVAGYLTASLGSIFGGHKKKTPPPQPWYVRHAIALTVGGVAVAAIGLGVLVYVRRH